MLSLKSSNDVSSGYFEAPGSFSRKASDHAESANCVQTNITKRAVNCMKGINWKVDYTVFRQETSLRLCHVTKLHILL